MFGKYAFNSSDSDSGQAAPMEIGEEQQFTTNTGLFQNEQFNGKALFGEIIESNASSASSSYSSDEGEYHPLTPAQLPQPRPRRYLDNIVPSAQVSMATNADGDEVYMIRKPRVFEKPSKDRPNALLATFPKRAAKREVQIQPAPRALVVIPRQLQAGRCHKQLTNGFCQRKVWEGDFCQTHHPNGKL